MQYSKYRLKLDVVSVVSLVHDYNTFICERLLSTLETNVSRIALSLSLSRTYFGWWASLSVQRCCCEWASFSGQFWTSGIHVFLRTATIGTLGRLAESAVECEQVSFVLVLWY